MPSPFEIDLSSLPAPSAEWLPLAHVTTVAALRRIFTVNVMDSGKTCTVYNERLFYTFYGRPAYRLKDTGEAHYGEAFAPACLLLKPDLLSAAKRVLPFDSGGYDYYPSVMHPSWTKEDFEIGAATGPAHLISLLYGANQSYMRRTPKAAMAIPASKLFLSQYYKLISSRLSLTADERCSSVEVQFGEPFTLDDHVLAVVLPETLMDPDTVARAAAFGYDLIWYRYDEPYAVGDFYKPLYWAVYDYLFSPPK